MELDYHFVETSGILMKSHPVGQLGVLRHLDSYRA